MSDRLERAIARYRNVQAELVHRLEEGEVDHALLRELDGHLQRSFDSVMELQVDSNDGRLARIAFLLNHIVPRSERDPLKSQICDRIYADAEEMCPNGKHADNI